MKSSLLHANHSIDGGTFYLPQQIHSVENTFILTTQFFNQSKHFSKVLNGTNNSFRSLSARYESFRNYTFLVFRMLIYTPGQGKTNFFARYNIMMVKIPYKLFVMLKIVTIGLLTFNAWIKITKTFFRNQKYRI